MLVAVRPQAAPVSASKPMIAINEPIGLFISFTILSLVIARPLYQLVIVYHSADVFPVSFSSAEFAQSFDLYLPGAFASHIQCFANIFQGKTSAIGQTKPHIDDLHLSRL